MGTKCPGLNTTNAVYVSHAAAQKLTTFDDSDLCVVLPRTHFQRHGGVMDALQSSVVAHLCHADATKHFVYLVFPHDVVIHLACFG